MKHLFKLFNNRITVAKLICLALLFSPLWGFWWFKIDTQVNWLLTVLKVYFLVNLPLGIFYFSVCFLAFISFVIVAFLRDPFIRVPLMIVMLLGWALELTILDINGTLSNQNLFWILWQEWATASEAVRGYGLYLVRDCASVAILGIALCASPTRRFSVPRLFGLLPIVSGALVAGVIIYTKGGTQVFPIPFGTFSNAAIVLASASDSANGVAKPFLNFDQALASDVPLNHDLKIEGPVHPIFDKIVMIMDESVRGDYLSLNDAARSTTPFLRATNHLINFGVASSGGNCSIISRMIFRFGMRQSDLPNSWREGLKRPNFWQFARRAGYKTVHIDAWYGSLSLGNGFSLSEKALIDSKINVIENPSYLRDQVLADKLIRALRDKERAFIYVEKFGTHFPYSDKYPPDFHPLPTPRESSKVPSTGSIGERALAHYPNAIAWSVDEFFRKLLPAVDPSKTLIIYTSDHGQNMLPGHSTHCSTTLMVPRGEEAVPLFAITSVPEFRESLEKAAARSFGRFSHFEIFPTLLLAMGYDADWVRRSYGPSLMDSPSPNRTFMIGSPNFQPMMIPVDRNFRPASSSSELHETQMSTADVK
jgi:glucan phosphoethanolaminetransferase (alkaline phosphatase superfamily)